MYNITYNISSMDYRYTSDTKLKAICGVDISIFDHKRGHC